MDKNKYSSAKQKQSLRSPRNTRDKIGINKAARKGFRVKETASTVCSCLKSGTVMTKTNLLTINFLIFIAACSTTALSSNSWYCHRLVPQFITSYVTPCTFPCLVVSRYEHPRIIVHTEADGTPCHVPAGLLHEGKIGKCQRSVCHKDRSYKILKRKKRFVCLIALVKLLKLRKQRKILQQQIQQLSDKLHHNGYNNIEEGASSVARRGNIDAGGNLGGSTANSMAGTSAVGNMGIGASGLSSSPFAETGSGTNTIGRADDFGFLIGNPFDGDISSDIVSGSGDRENAGFRGTDSASMRTGVSREVYNSNNPSSALDIEGSGSD